MLIACHTCARQYDVTGLEPGQRIRCACGELNEIPEPRTREAPMQRCASCGGELQGDDRTEQLGSFLCLTLILTNERAAVPRFAGRGNTLG